jgi:hypothetical protein
MKAKIGALVISALILTVAVPAVSAGPFEEARERYQDAREAFQQAYADWLTARADFLDARIQWRKNRTEANLMNAIEKAKIALLKADNAMIRRLEVLRVGVEATRGLTDNEKAAIYAEIDADISWLQEKQEDIQAADNAREIMSIALTVWDYWRDVRVKIKQITGQILSAWLDALVQKAEAFAGRVGAKVQELKDNGIDTSQLEAWLSDYNSKRELAEQKYDAAKEKFSQISSEADADGLFREGVAFIREGNSYLRDAFKALRDIVSDMRKKGHTVTLSGSGTLIGHGDGRAYITGTGVVHVLAPIQGTMLVSPNANVRAVGEGTKTVLENGWVQYQGYGSAMVTGTDIVVDISGTKISLLAAGTGTAVLTGTGWYRTYGENYYRGGPWIATGVTATLATGETTEG